VGEEEHGTGWAEVVEDSADQEVRRGGRAEDGVGLAASLPQVSECHRITGEDCFLIRVHAPTIQELEETLDRFLLYGQTVTSMVVSTPVPRRPLPIDA
jgi:Lrp/AsnC family leucine-responsive transcriptional regulator